VGRRSPPTSYVMFDKQRARHVLYLESTRTMQ